MSRSDTRARLALIVIVGAMLSVFLLKTAEPYRMARQARAEAKSLEDEVARLEAQNALAERRLEALQTDRGIEVEARKHHYIRPWEVPVRVVYEGVEGQAVEEHDTDPP